jgi:peptidoglycan/xylan/chitin deacetylase (PgdA/CDA1 family)
MRLLKDRQFNIVSLKTLVTLIRKKQPLPDKTVAITFDDGFSNLHSVAYPILKSCGFTATIFLVPSYCGKNNQWLGQPKGIPILDLLDWKRIREMNDDGFDFGAHTMEHADLSTLPAERAREEIVNSKLAIQERLERPVRFFAYPYGSVTREIRSIVSDEFSGACSVEMDFSTLRSDDYMLPRIDMYYFSDNNCFASVGTYKFHLFVKILSYIRTFRRRMNHRTIGV